MVADNQFVDQAGHEVLRFIFAARNLSRIGELADEVIAIAKSSSWRRYQTAVGLNEWRESEFDYFLMACDLSHEDIGRVVLHTQDWATLAPIMDANADSSRRRALEEAAETWPFPSQETLVQRARRLGWTRGPASTKLRPAPLPPRRKPNNLTQGISRDYMLRRLARERPELYRSVLADELSPYGAMRQAGFIPKVITINTDPEKAAQAIRRHFDKDALTRLVKLLQED